MRADFEAHIARVDKFKPPLWRKDKAESLHIASRFINFIGERSKIKFANFISGEARGDVVKISRRTPLKFLAALASLKFSP